MRVIPISKAVAETVCGSATQTSKMPHKSYSLPVAECITGSLMAKIEGSICSKCYAMGGNYLRYANNVEPAQYARLDSVWQAMQYPDQAELWVSAIVALIGSDSTFRWHDSGDLQGVQHLRLIALVAMATPDTLHWLPTREYSMVKEYLDLYGALPENLTVRLSAMYIDKPVIVPASLRGVSGVEVSNVHQHATPNGAVCNAPAQGGKCLDCRLCFTRSGAVSYAFH